MDDGNALHLDGVTFGIIPNGTEPLLDTTPDCSMLPESAPWIEVSRLEVILGRKTITRLSENRQSGAFSKA
eukprot:COSAG02_NODE_12756_length_1499_cov_1.314286_1_plen_71_part_00